MFKRILQIFFITIFIFILSACGKKQSEAEGTGTAYGITYKDNIGIATVKVKGDVVTEASFDEVFLPNTWAKIKSKETEVPAEIVSDTKGVWFGKYLKIGNKNFTGTLREENLEIEGVKYTNQTVKYSAEGIDDLYIWLTESEENRKWYADAVSGGKSYVAKANFTDRADYETAGQLTPEGKLGFTKSTTKYWEGPNYPLGWKGNMTEIVKAIVGTKMNSSVDKITKEGNYWKINDIVTGATNQDFKNYYLLAQTAYNKALKP